MYSYFNENRIGKFISNGNTMLKLGLLPLVASALNGAGFVLRFYQQKWKSRPLCNGRPLQCAPYPMTLESSAKGRRDGEELASVFSNRIPELKPAPLKWPAIKER